MSIFTQVWLWSVAAFAIGVLLTVLLLVLPARKQVKELQRRLTAAEAAPREATRQFTPEPRAEREPTRTFDPGPAAAATAYQPAFEPEAPRGFESEAPRGFESEVPRGFETEVPRGFESERTEAVVPTRTFEPEPPRGFEPADQPRQAYEAEQAYAGQQEFESERTFEPEQPYAAERQYEAEQEFGGDRQHEGERQYDASQPYEGEQFDAEQEFGGDRQLGGEQPYESEQRFDAERGDNEPAYGNEPAYNNEAAYDNGQPYEDGQPYNNGQAYEDGQAYANESTTAYQPALDPEPIQSDIELRPHYEVEAEPHHESVEQSWFSRQQKAEETVYYNGSGVLKEDEDRPGSLFTPAPAEEEPPAYAFSDEEAEPSYEEELAAERTQVLPKRQPRQAPPGGFDPPQPIEPSVRQIERREPAPEHASGSLFEPAGTNGTIPEPPPARDFVPETSVPLGPFGPGSAMPKPGGGRPSDDFTVKASVTALRYCTEDSPQFPRMVAEVWFRSATDAERVGFRPLG